MLSLASGRQNTPFKPKQGLNGPPALAPTHEHPQPSQKARKAGPPARMLRSLLVEAAQSAVRLDPQFRKQYLHRCHQKPKVVAKVAAARKLAVRLYWMLRSQVGYPEIVRIESSPRVALVGAS